MSIAAFYMSKRFSLSIATFKKYAYAFEYGTMLHDKIGYPPTFDKISQGSIKEVTSIALRINNPEYLSHLRKKTSYQPRDGEKSTQYHNNMTC